MPRDYKPLPSTTWVYAGASYPPLLCAIFNKVVAWSCQNIIWIMFTPFLNSLQIQLRMAHIALTCTLQYGHYQPYVGISTSIEIQYNLKLAH